MALSDAASAATVPTEQRPEHDDRDKEAGACT
jgi:hypothetical protein